RDLRKPFEIQNMQRRVRQTFPKNKLSVRLKSRLQVGERGSRFHKSHIDAEFPQRTVKKIESTAVDSTGTDNMVSGSGNIEHSQHNGRLPCRRKQSADAPFQGGDLRLHRSGSGIGK